VKSVFPQRPNQVVCNPSAKQQNKHTKQSLTTVKGDKQFERHYSCLRAPSIGWVSGGNAKNVTVWNWVRSEW